MTASPKGDSTLADGELARAMRTRLRQRLELETSDEDMARVLDTSKLEVEKQAFVIRIKLGNYWMPVAALRL